MTVIVKTCGADSRPRVSSALDGSHLTEHVGDFPARCPQMNRARCQESAQFIEGRGGEAAAMETNPVYNETRFHPKTETTLFLIYALFSF
ncbi:hypothetical protein DPX16_22384 [Anabarilius grahami]|uniref:Uncharacterized protein n=1 Tax=Anabarilius grahami TaxID=495550 RepID=A0A3N0Z053_ANAGA|nr:hypothetical protein DPX16_22384 [Anabarilius grahami]